MTPGPPGPPRSPPLLRLTAEGFRNLAPLAWDVAPGAHLLLGDNGSGKTSLLEAAYVVATTRSFRAAQLAECVRHGESEFRLSADAPGPGRPHLVVSWSEGRRERSLNGKACAAHEHLAALPILAWTTADSELLGGPPAVRRRFLDRGLVGLRPATLDLLARYQRALAQKRLLLLRREAGIEPWNELLAQSAAELIRVRSAYAEKLATSLAAVLGASGLGFPPIALQYQPSPAEGLTGASAVHAALQAAAAAERRRRLPLVGPQRDELRILWAGQEARRVASAGERKALGLALLAAQAKMLGEAGREPLLLLDDADVELDRGALSRIFGAFAERAQVLVSSNRPEVWSGLDFSHRWRLEAGHLTAG